jgi:hypothetical protein
LKNQTTAARVKKPSSTSDLERFKEFYHINDSCKFIEGPTTNTRDMSISELLKPKDQ